MNFHISLQLDLYIFNAINGKTSDLMSIFHSQNERKLFTFSNRSSIIRTKHKTVLKIQHANDK